jgi:ABC-type uncharacterized transport system permease subunit
VVVIAGMTALLLKQPMGWAVCAVGLARRRSDLPAQGDSRAFRTFVGLLLGLSLIAWAGSTPG